jgi:hypothetical protein
MTILSIILDKIVETILFEHFDQFGDAIHVPIFIF